MDSFMPEHEDQIVNNFAGKVVQTNTGADGKIINAETYVESAENVNFTLSLTPQQGSTNIGVIRAKDYITIHGNVETVHGNVEHLYGDVEKVYGNVGTVYGNVGQVFVFQNRPHAEADFDQIRDEWQNGWRSSFRLQKPLHIFTSIFLSTCLVYFKLEESSSSIHGNVDHLCVMFHHPDLDQIRDGRQNGCCISLRRVMALISFTSVFLSTCLVYFNLEEIFIFPVDAVADIAVFHDPDLDQIRDGRRSSLPLPHLITRNFLFCLDHSLYLTRDEWRSLLLFFKHLLISATFAYAFYINLDAIETGEYRLKTLS